MAELSSDAADGGGVGVLAAEAAAGGADEAKVRLSICDEQTTGRDAYCRLRSGHSSEKTHTREMILLRRKETLAYHLLWSTDVEIGQHGGQSLLVEAAIVGDIARATLVYIEFTFYGKKIERVSKRTIP